MTRYKDNPSLSFKTVTTVNGETEYRANCRMIKDVYYIIKQDVFEIDGTWYRVNGGNLIYNDETKEWVVKDSEKGRNLVKGIVNVNEDGEPKIGFFSKNP